MQMPAMTEVQGQTAASRLQLTQQHLKPENKKTKKPLPVHFHGSQTAHGHNLLLQDCWIINDALIEKAMRTFID